MAEIAAYKALRFTEKAGEISELVCPPYDIISEEDRRGYLRRNPNNVIRLELPLEGEDKYQTAGEVLGKWLDQGVLAKDAKDGIYVYEEEFTVNDKSFSFRGIICRVKLEEFSKGIVLPHEETLSKAKQDRFSLMNATHCNFSQVYSLYIDDSGTAEKIKNYSAGNPIQEFSSENVIHRLWVIDDADQIEIIIRDFAERKLYIADGHHRYETALNFRNHLRESGQAKPGDDCDYMMMMLVDMANPGLVVFPTHRIIKGISNFDGVKLISHCSELFHVEQVIDRNAAENKLAELYATGEKSFGYFDKSEKWQVLTLKDRDAVLDKFSDKSEALALLDVSILHSLILEEHLGISKENLANQSNLIYTRDSSEAEAAVNDGADCCFIMNPTKVEEIAAVAAAGEKMPQKSTYFYPKLITGLVMNQIDFGGR